MAAPQSESESGQGTARATRRRGEALNQAIHEATLAELREYGYAATTFGSVARRAGTSRSVLYRRYRSRAQMVAEALSSLARHPQEPPRLTGSLHGDLRQFAQGLLNAHRTLPPDVARGAMGEADEDIIPELDGITIAPAVETLRQILNSARERGELGSADIPRLTLLTPFFVVRHDTLLHSPDDSFVDQFLNDGILPMFQALSNRPEDSGTTNERDIPDVPPAAHATLEQYARLLKPQAEAAHSSSDDQPNPDAPTIKSRRRGKALERAIHEATLLELWENGYNATTFVSVARRAGTSRSVLYRRYPSRADLVSDALLAKITLAATTPTTDSLRNDLHRWVEDLAAPYRALGPQTCRSLVGDSTPELAYQIRVTHSEVLTAAVEKPLAAARERGELGPARIPRFAPYMALAVLRYSALLRPLTDEFLDQLVDDMLLPTVLWLSNR